MKHIFIIRHGETDNNKNGIIQGRGVNAPLNDKGRQQALALLEILEDYPIQKVIASSLVRTHQTAEPIIQQYKLQLQTYSDLDEIDFGELEGKEFDSIDEEIDLIHSKWKSGQVDYTAAGGESPRQVFERANNRIKKILAESEEEYIAFVLHGRLIRILLSEWLGHGLKNMHLIEHQNCAVNILKWDEDKFEAVQLNCVDHLAELVE